MSYLVDGRHRVVVVLDGVLDLRQGVVRVVQAVVRLRAVAAPIVGVQTGTLGIVVTVGVEEEK